MRKIYTSIDIGNDTIRILVSEYLDGKLNTLAVSSVRTKGLSSSNIIDEDVLSERLKLALDDILKRIDIEIKKVILIVPTLDLEFDLVYGNVPIVNDQKMVSRKDILRVQNSVSREIAPNMELINITPIDFTIYENGSLIETLNNPINKICDRLGVRAMLTTMPKAKLIPYIKVLESVGIEVVDIVLSSICDFEEIKNEELENSVSSIINIGKSVTTISVFNKGIITNSKTLKMGSSIIDDDISYIYNISKKNARKIKENFGIAHPRYANKNETYEVKDVNGKLISINQYELSEIVNKRLVEILNLAKNELKVLTNKQIRYIMVIGGITDMPAMRFVTEDMFGNDADIYSLNTLGIRKSRYIASIGAIKYFIKKLKLSGKEYSMFSSDDIDNLVHSKNKIGKDGSIFGRFFNYFFDN